MLSHLLEVAVSLLSGYDTGLGNSNNGGVVVGALHIFLKQLLLGFYLFNTVFFQQGEKRSLSGFFYPSLLEVIKKKNQDSLAVASSQEWCVTNCDQENRTSRTVKQALCYKSIQG